MTPFQRRKMKYFMDYLHEYRSKFGYEERRPMVLPFMSFVEINKAREIISDCSETVIAVCKWAKLKDPSGYNYSGYGNSESILNHLPHYFNARLAGIGAIVHFRDPDHVAFVYKTSRILGNPMLWEHGRPGVAIVPLSIEKQLHNGPVTFLRVSKL